MTSEIEVDEYGADAPADKAPWWTLRPISAVAFIFLLVIGGVVGYAWWTTRVDTSLGSHGRVTAHVGDDCAHVRIAKDGMRFGSTMSAQGAGPDLGRVLQEHETSPLPSTWRGTDVKGTLEVVSAAADGGVIGVFTADDGTVVVLPGASGGTYFQQASCAIWPSD